MPSWWWLVRSVSGHFPSPGHSLHICRREAYFSTPCRGVIKWSSLLLSNQIKGVTTSIKNKKKKSEQRWTLFLDKYIHSCTTQAYIGVCVRVCVRARTRSWHEVNLPLSLSICCCQEVENYCFKVPFRPGTSDWMSSDNFRMQTHQFPGYSVDQ